MNRGKEDYRRYNVLSTRYHVLNTKYHVPHLRQAGKIPQKYDLGQNTNPYFVLRTWYSPPLLHSSISVRHSTLV